MLAAKGSNRIQFSYDSKRFNSVDALCSAKNWHSCVLCWPVDKKRFVKEATATIETVRHLSDRSTCAT